jgi:Holliday junction DNA helicase RuvA
VLDIGTCEGIDIWKFIQLIAGDVPGVDDPVAVTVYASDGYKNDLLSVFFREGLVNGVSGVGPKTALATLSGFSVGDLQLAIAQGDAKRIATVKGVGKKTAERMVVELKDKVNPIEALANSSTASGAEQSTVLRDAMLALVALGFGEDAVRKMVSDVLEADPGVADAETVIKRALGGGK